LKRTGEIILSSVGAFLNLLGVLGFGLFTTFSQTDFFMYSVLEGYGTPEEVFIVNIIAGFGWFWAILSLLAMVAGIVAIFFYKGNKRPKAASIMLLITSVILVFGTFGMAFLAFLCYLIAGIMGLVRKPPQTDEEEPEGTEENAVPASEA